MYHKNLFVQLGAPLALAKQELHHNKKAFLIINFYRKSVIAGMTAGAFGQFIASPTDLVKVQMQMEGKRVLIEGRQPRYAAHSTC